MSGLAAEPESQRLKALGLVLLGLSVPLFIWLGDEAVHQWPPQASGFVGFVLVAALAMNLVAFGLMWLVIGCGGRLPWRSPRTLRAWALRLAGANLALPMLIFGLLSDSAEADAEFNESFLYLLLSVLMLLLAAALAWLYRRSRRHEAPGAAQAMAADPRAPVLYLRSFRDDGHALMVDLGWPRVQAALGAVMPVSAEEELADALAGIGPVIAIGKPGEPLPELGAARLYIGHDVWQAEVNALMQKAALVVVRVGASPGVLWEINQVLENLPRERLVLVLLGGEPLAPQIAGRLAAVLGDALAAAVPFTPRRWQLWLQPCAQRIGALVCFGPGSVARVVQVSGWPLAWADIGYALTLRPSAGALRRAWREVFGVLGLVPGSSRQQGMRLRAALLALFFGWTGAHWFYLGRRRRGWAYLLMFPVGLTMMWVDAIRFVWVDRAEFDRRFASSVA